MSPTRAAGAGPELAARELKIEIAGETGSVSVLWWRPQAARWLLVLGHGAGSGMRHPFLEHLSRELAVRGIATLRYRFPYREAGRRRPDRTLRLEATARAAMAAASDLAPDLPLLAGGKSMGGRMASRAVAGGAPAGLRGLVFFGFPLHPAGRPGIERADHLAAVRLPMLFLQGDRDRLADLDLLRPVCHRLGDRAQLRIIAGADHGFHVPKRSGRSDAEVVEALADATADWAAGLDA